MRIADFDYHLPPELIAQEPARPRDASRMLVVDRQRQQVEHRHFRDVLRYLRPDDVVVLNDTRVIRARLRGRRHPGGGRAEVLLLGERGDGVWEALVTPGRRAPTGRRIVFGDGELRAEVVARSQNGSRLLRFSGPSDLSAALARLGEVPLPPYIHTAVADESDYQTIYGRSPGASAAPTAGLHFTAELLAAMQDRVHAVAYLTLHVGVGSFRPVRTANIEEHEMHAEGYRVPDSTARMLTAALAEGRRIVAVGTSTARALESASAGGSIRPGGGETKLFIRPGYTFQSVGALLTNFHMPRSTLLLMVCAFAERCLVMRAYRAAAELKYRFLSFGDAMLIV